MPLETSSSLEQKTSDITPDGRTGKQRLRHFSTILGFQIISEFGSALTSFSLGVWAYQKSDSFTAYGLIFFAASMSIFLAAPIAGTIVDRLDKKRVLLFSSLGSAFISLSIGILYWLEVLEIWHIFFLTLANGVIMAFSKPAIVTSIKILIDPEDLSRANGIMATGFGMVSLLAPVVAGVLMVKYGLFTILMIDLASFAAGIIALSMLRLPARVLAPSETVLQGISFAWGYLKKKSHLLWLIGFYAVLNFFIGIAVVLLQPMVLSLTDAEGLGRVMAISGLGYLSGAVLIGVWGGPKRKMFVIYGAALFMGMGMVVTPMSTNIWILSLGAFLLSAAVPIFLTANVVIIQKKVETQVLGRVDGLGTIITGFFLPMGYLVAGPIAESFFEPLMQTSNESMAFWQDLYGLGKGRGVAMMISLSSMIMVFIVLVAMLLPKLRRIEIDLPDEV